MESERSILRGYNNFLFYQAYDINYEYRQICLAAYFCAKRNILNWWRYEHIIQYALH